MKDNLLYLLYRFGKHLRTFHFIWILLGALIISPIIFHVAPWILYPTIALFFIYLIWNPLGAVYGLVGTTGSIKLFFIIFLVISFLFSLAYYFGFFMDAGISYNSNQPHIDYQYFANCENRNPQKVLTKRDTIICAHQIDSIAYKGIVIHETRDTLYYQSIGFVKIWRSTILTTLTQEPTELLANATVNNAAMESTNSGIDKEKSELFEWILIFHIIISWIFFGVFISLLYNKFRYES